MALFGKNAKIYYSSVAKATISDSNSLTWTECVNIVDETDTFTPTEVDVTDRELAALGWEATEVILKAGDISFGYQMEDPTSDTIWAALLSAFENTTKFTALILSGEKSVTTSRGFAANFTVALTWAKPVKDRQLAQVALKVGSGAYPEWVTGSSGL